jgi:hypothetical protein
MKITLLLKRDHASLRDLFDDFDNADPKGRREVFERIRAAFELHAQLEEELLYPELQKHDETRPAALEALQEHRLVKQLLAEIGRERVFDDDVVARVKVLRENVEHHVEEEEDEMFEKARDVLGEAALSELGRHFEKRRDALVRARPSLAPA